MTAELRLVARLAQVSDELLGIPVIVVEETMRGWLSALSKERQIRRQVFASNELAQLFRFFAAFEIICFDDAAAAQLDQFGRIQVGMMDKKIAAITIVNNALLLTANRSDYSQFPGLRFDNWMD